MNSPAKEPAANKTLLIDWSPLAVLLILSAVVYSSTLNYEYSWDDELFLSKSPEIADLSSLKKAFTVDYWGLTNNPENPEGSPLYRPLALSVIILERSVFNTDPAHFRLIHSLWHLINIALVFVLSRKLIRGLYVLGPIFAACTFAALPYTVDTVLFLTSICDLMALSFTLLTSISFLAWLDRAETRYVFVVVLASAAAMMSKENAVSIPFVLAAIYWYVRDPARNRRALIAIAASFATVCACLIVRETVVTTFTGNTLLEFFKWLPISLAVAFRWAILPFPLVLEQSVSHAWSNPAWWFGCFGISAALFLTYRYRYRFGLLVTGLCVWVVLVIPSLVAIGWTGVFAPRYLYLPALGLSLAVGYFASVTRRSIRILICVLLVGTGLVTISRTTAWKDSFTLWAIEVGRQPDSLSALTNLGNLLVKRGEYQNALAFQLKAARIAEENNYQCRSAFAYSNAATILTNHLGDIESGLELFEKCTALCPYKAQNAWVGIARIHAMGGQWIKAEQAAQKAIEIGPLRSRVLVLRARILAAQEKTEEALDDLAKARKLVLKNPAKLAEVDRVIADVRKSIADRN
ncbi:MAG: hypothetical protein GY847_41430 [Proteobacteria bacterium]|nr:hypothetical protein [Pseudomonadota bacterium]